MRMLKTDTIVNQFRINLLTNSYVMQRTLAKQIHMLFVKSRQSSQALGNFAEPFRKPVENPNAKIQWMVCLSLGHLGPPDFSPDSLDHPIQRFV